MNDEAGSNDAEQRQAAISRIREQVLSLATFAQKVYTDLHDHAGRTIITVDVHDVLRILDASAGAEQ